MLISCPGEECRRQYDVTGLQPGEHVRCLCGQLLEVKAPRPVEVRALHCSGCGGTLEEGATECGYCGGAISLDERNLGESCPECFARLHVDARYCRCCGIRIRARKLESRRTGQECPRCRGALVLCTVPGGEYTECSSCGGMWIAEDSFDEIVEHRDASPLGKVVAAREARSETKRHGVTYLPCPVCQGLMHRQNFARCSGVIIDWCKGHGFWFDTHELEKILAFVQGGGLDKARKLEIDRKKRELRRIEDQRDLMGPASAYAPARATSMDTFVDQVTGYLGAALRGWLS